MLLHDQMIETYLSKSALAIDLQDIKVKKPLLHLNMQKLSICSFWIRYQEQTLLQPSLQPLKVSDS